MWKKSLPGRPEVTAGVMSETRSLSRRLHAGQGNLSDLRRGAVRIGGHGAHVDLAQHESITSVPRLAAIEKVGIPERRQRRRWKIEQCLHCQNPLTLHLGSKLREFRRVCGVHD